MLARIWRGATTAADADAYRDYLERTGMAAYAATPGNRGALALRRIVGDRAEFVTLSLWDSEAAIRAFAAPPSADASPDATVDIERAVFYPDDDRFLVECDLHVAHFEIVVGGVGAPFGESGR